MTFIYVGLLRLRSLAVWWYGEETSVSLASVACSGCRWYFILALFAMSSANFTTELSPCHVCSTGFNAQTVCVGERVQYPAAECGTQRAVPFHQFYWWDCVECKSTNGIFSGLCRLSGQVGTATSVHLFWLHAGEGPGLQGCYLWCAEESVPQNTQDQTQQTF